MMQILENEDQWLHEFQKNWLAHYLRTGETNWKIYNRPRNADAPEGSGIDLAESKLIFISSAGSYIRDTQNPFDAADLLGDYSIRTYPPSTPLSALAIAHEHYDHTAVNSDRQVLIPLRHLEDLVSEGIIGAIAPQVISFHGYQPDATRVVHETIPAILDVALGDDAQAALLVPA